MISVSAMLGFFFFNDTATTEIYTLSLHDALPIFLGLDSPWGRGGNRLFDPRGDGRSEEHTSELQSRSDIVCRLLLEKKKKPTHAAQRLGLRRAVHDPPVGGTCLADPAHDV